jgi:Ca2+-binding EF-hand superfamily protein
MPANVDWAAMRAKLPMEKTAEQKAQRADLFMQFDPNGNGYLSLAEVDKGCRDVLGLYDVFEAKPVIMRAFQAAKGANDKKGKASRGPDYVEKCEFRLLFVYLRQYFEIWQMFDDIDSGDDRRVSIAEFQKAVPLLNSWGADITDAEAEFKKIDKNGGGQVLFDEFAHYALSKNLDLEDDDE